MLTTVYLILSMCNGHSCDFEELGEFTGSKENAIQVCQIERQDYPASDDIKCYFKTEDSDGVYFDSVDGQDEIIIDKD
ncbi:hypothetical protein [Escherichia phage REP10]|uniref:Uncharacterized protein n=1 Tax=Escherichia phage REP8 TaxID=3022461 RepID=A0AAF0AXX5_9CAUD|nr:hypothetical protein [Escherichia phage REP8]WBY53875.1 hypothetical protein [Escherichia phage REP9]WBY54049.1 hypothetical protein [Escherichia phage REP10]WBY54056.1 hypothetical protein [Escherichia phage REP11]WBY54295.1 hypothetical protein [Escherichia phage REP12]